MKKLLFASLIIFCAACSTNSEKTTQEESPAKAEVVVERKYVCPMKCEGEKTYAEAGKCPVCKMDLQEVAMAEEDSTGHNH